MVTVIKPADGFVLYGADCLDVLRFMPDNSVDSIVTDPPAGISFMGKDWDKDKGGRDAWVAWMQEIAVECLRVVKPGGHALVWALPRTSHWTGTAWENAGWEPRDKIVHLFGSGFPKSHSVGKAIDKAAGAERPVIGHQRLGGNAAQSTAEKGGTYASNTNSVGVKPIEVPITVASTPEAAQWEGWGTALKPASEDWWLLRKPLEGTVAKCVLKYGTGALHIDACRVPYESGEVNFDRKQRQQNSEGAIEGAFGAASLIGTEIDTYKEAGRWPANVTHDGSDEVLAGFPDAGNNWKKNYGEEYKGRQYAGGTFGGGGYLGGFTYADSGSAARFFYCAKASTTDREEGLEDLPEQMLAYSNGAQATINDGEDEYTGGSQNIGLNKIKKRKNPHPTVKNTELMRYLTRLITPAGGVCLDPFMGSGSTGKACALEGFRFVGIEQEPSYLPVAEARIKYALGKAK